MQPSMATRWQLLRLPVGTLRRYLTHSVAAPHLEALFSIAAVPQAFAPACRGGLLPPAARGPAPPKLNGHTLEDVNLDLEAGAGL